LIQIQFPVRRVFVVSLQAVVKVVEQEVKRVVALESDHYAQDMLGFAEL
jgi:hypothetical protein